MKWSDTGCVMEVGRFGARRVLDVFRAELAARVSGWDPSYQAYDVQERIEIRGYGSNKESYVNGFKSFRERRSSRTGSPQPEFVRVTYEDTHWERKILDRLGTVRPEHRRLVKLAIRRAAITSGRITGDSLPFSDDDYEFLPPNPADEPPLLGKAAADQVRDLWLAAWLRELMPVLLALLPDSRTPAIADIRRVLILLALLAERESTSRASARPIQIDPPPRTRPCALTVLTQTAPHGPDNLADAKPVPLVRALEVAA